MLMQMILSPRMPIRLLVSTLILRSKRLLRRDADNFLSKYLINSSMGYVTGGLKGFGIMSLSSLYSSSDAEYIQSINT